MTLRLNRVTGQAQTVKESGILIQGQQKQARDTMERVTAKIYI